MGVPYYMVITLVADERLSSYTIQLDKVKYTEGLLVRSYARRKKLTGLKENDPQSYYALEYLSRYYSDGSGVMFSKNEWLEIFGLGDIETNFEDNTVDFFINAL